MVPGQRWPVDGQRASERRSELGSHECVGRARAGSQRTMHTDEAVSRCPSSCSHHGAQQPEEDSVLRSCFPEPAGPSGGGAYPQRRPTPAKLVIYNDLSTSRSAACPWGVGIRSPRRGEDSARSAQTLACPRPAFMPTPIEHGEQTDSAVNQDPAR
ncbi:hypothetical protein AAFF_G00351630 [Aldrovandia affinis]|uniref:Uncharacterized protein n=1 Tax=Aldrovandia affinis TaxID=143900 RepID=A0AAD7WNB6_9TELE|nr:hypothetical protein AAFF_G00351630 [Aldrovandia affinis]